LFTDLARPPLQASITDVVAPDQRGRAFATLYWAINLGFAGAAVLGGSLAERSFTPLFVIDALTTFSYGTIVFLAVPDTRPPATAPPARPARALDLHALAAPFLDRRFMRFLMVQAVLLIAFAQVIVSLPLDMRNHGLPTVQIGWLLGLNGLLIVIAQPIVLRFVRGFSHAQWLVAGAGLTGVGLGVNALAGGAAVYALATLIWTMGEIGFSTATPAIIGELAPLDRRGAYHGANQVVWGAAFMTAPLLGSFVLAHAGGGALWLGCLAAGVSAAALHRRRAAPDRPPSVS
jgi:MFS family permease